MGLRGWRRKGEGTIGPRLLRYGRDQFAASNRAPRRNKAFDHGQWPDSKERGGPLKESAANRITVVAGQPDEVFLQPMFTNCARFYGVRGRLRLYVRSDPCPANADPLGRLSRRKFDLLTPELKDNILSFYIDLNVSFDTKKSPSRWQRSLQERDTLKLAATAPGPMVGPRNRQSQNVP